MKKFICIILGITLAFFNSVVAAKNVQENNKDAAKIIVEEESNNNSVDSQSSEDNISNDENVEENIDSEVDVSDEGDIYPSDDSEEIDLLNSQRDAVYLDVKPNKKKKVNKAVPEIKDESVNSLDSNDFRISPQNVNTYRSNDIYSKKTTSFTNEKTMGNLSFGSKYDNSFTMNEYTGTRTLFSKYNINKFSFGASYKNDSLSSFGQQFRGTFSISPEYRLNDHISLQSVYSKNFMDRSNKNELIFNLKPFKDDRMNFNVGASQIYYEDATPMRSQLNFATKINF